MAAVIPPILLTPSVRLAPRAQWIPSASWSSPPRPRSAQSKRSAHAKERVVHRAVCGRSSASVPMVLAVVLVLMALVVAPEQPQDQEAICQRHSGEAACRVW